MFRCSFYIMVDIKKNSEDIGPNVPMLHFWYKQ